jgi:hypothetical protein
VRFAEAVSSASPGSAQDIVWLFVPVTLASHSTRAASHWVPFVS